MYDDDNDELDDAAAFDGNDELAQPLMKTKCQCEKLNAKPTVWDLTCYNAALKILSRLNWSRVQLSRVFSHRHI
ncbi:hypothetical protein ACLKA6_014405 [Drosophila palustris]